MFRRSVLALLAVCTLALVHAGWLSTVLPEVVASHFDAAGHANGWMPRAWFVRFYVGLVFFLTGMFLVTGLAMSGADPARINLPNKDHWLAPERRQETLAWISDWSRWMGVGALLLITAVIHLAGQANLGGTFELGGGAAALLVTFIVFSVAMLVRMMLRFARPL
jgi:hypothetical protein